MSALVHPPRSLLQWRIAALRGLKTLRRAVLTLALVIVASFALLKLAPGDLADVIAGDAGSASPEIMEALRHQYGLDQSIPVQFGHYLLRLAHGDLGYSYKHAMPVIDLIVARIPGTLTLLLTSMVIALVIGIALGTLTAYQRTRWPDTLFSTLTTIGFATPIFWVGLMLITLFSVELRWLPSGGIASTLTPLGEGGRVLDAIRHLVLPATTLSLFYVSIYARVVRASVIDVLASDFVRTAKSKGLTRSRIVIRHVLRNSLLSLVTISALEIGTLLSGAITVETVFSWPGMGRLAYEAVDYRDVNLLMGILLLSAIVVVIVNALLDVVYVLIDPRISVR